jgi:hypothetical protein
VAHSARRERDRLRVNRRAKITYVQAGHLSMITKPQAVAAVIEQAARAS